MSQGSSGLSGRRWVQIGWSPTWRAVALGVAAGGILGILAGVVLTVAGRAEPIRGVAGILGYLAGFPIFLYLLGWLLERKDFGSFQVRVIERRSDRDAVGM